MNEPTTTAHTASAGHVAARRHQESHAQDVTRAYRLMNSHDDSKRVFDTTTSHGMYRPGASPTTVATPARIVSYDRKTLSHDLTII